jgi:iron complex outermembrane receptor protein
LATFFNVYDHLITQEPEAPFLQTTPAPARFVIPLTRVNNMHGTTAGAEGSVNWKVTHRWALSPGYTLLRMHLHTTPTSPDTISAPDIEGSNPRHQAQLRSHVDLSHGLAWDTSAYFIDALPFQHVASYTRVDTHLSWQFRHGVTLSVVGQNLVKDHHLESQDFLSLVNSSQPKRSFYAKITWQSNSR